MVDLHLYIPEIDHKALARMWRTSPKDIAARCRAGHLKAEKRGRLWYITWGRVESPRDEESLRIRDSGADQGQVPGKMVRRREEDLRTRKKHQR